MSFEAFAVSTGVVALGEMSDTIISEIGSLSRA